MRMLYFCTIFIQFAKKCHYKSIQTVLCRYPVLYLLISWTQVFSWLKIFQSITFLMINWSMDK